MRVSIRMTGGAAFHQEMMHISNAPRDPRFWKKVEAVLMTETLRCFQGQHAPDGSAWKPLSDATLRSRAYRRTKGYRKTLKRIKGSQSKAFQRNMGSAKILQDGGVLRRSIATESGSFHALIGTTLKYAATHQYGRGRIPARPFIGLSQAGEERIVQMMLDWIAKRGGG